MFWRADFSGDFSGMEIQWQNSLKAIISYGLALAGMNALFYLSLQRLPLGMQWHLSLLGR
jgi:inner membrane transporter RhtA